METAVTPVSVASNAEEAIAVINAANALLARLDGITTAEFSNGGERTEREALRQALDLFGCVA